MEGEELERVYQVGYWLCPNYASPGWCCGGL